MIRANFTLFIWLINIKALPLHRVFLLPLHRRNTEAVSVNGG